MRRAATISGVILILLGLLGFIPFATPDNRLFGLFLVNAENNILHIGSGLGAIWAASVSPHAARAFFQIFGAVYLGLAIIGFYLGEGMILGVVASNPAGVVLHALIAIGLLLLGFVPRRAAAPASAKH